MGVLHANEGQNRVRTGPPVGLRLDPLDDRFEPDATTNSCQIRILLERQREQILADYQAEIQKREFQADHDRRSIKELNGIIESQRKRN